MSNLFSYGFGQSTSTAASGSSSNTSLVLDPGKPAAPVVIVLDKEPAVEEPSDVPVQVRVQHQTARFDPRA